MPGILVVANPLAGGRPGGQDAAGGGGARLDRLLGELEAIVRGYGLSMTLCAPSLPAGLEGELARDLAGVGAHSELGNASSPSGTIQPDGMQQPGIGQQSRRRTYAAIASVGGDGTLSALCRALASIARRLPGGMPGLIEQPPALPLPPVLVIPAGTGNSFYRELWGETPWQDAVKAAAEHLVATTSAAKPRAIDLGWIEELRTTFVLGASAGFFRSVLDEALEARARGRQARAEPIVARDGEYDDDPAAGSRSLYEEAVTMALARFEPPVMRVVVDGELLADGPVVAVAVGGGRYRGGRSPVLPRSDPGDGLLDVATVRATSGGDVVSALLPLLAGQLDDPGVSYVQGRKVTISAGPGAILALEHDGEPDGPATVRGGDQVRGNSGGAEPAVMARAMTEGLASCSIRVLPAAVSMFAPVGVPAHPIRT